MPQRVLAIFVKYIIFEQQKMGFLADATPSTIAFKEKAIWRLIDQLKVLQQMQTSLDDIVSRMVQESSVESEIQPVSMHAASSSLL